jgi:hypothetical protein
MDPVEKLRRLGPATCYEPAEEVSAAGRPLSAPVGLPADLSGFIHYAAMPGGRRIALLKTLLTSACERDCFYCAFRAGRDCPRATLHPGRTGAPFSATPPARYRRGALPEFFHPGRRAAYPGPTHRHRGDSPPPLRLSGLHPPEDHARRGAGPGGRGDATGGPRLGQPGGPQRPPSGRPGPPQTVHRRTPPPTALDRGTPPGDARPCSQFHHPVRRRGGRGRATWNCCT